MYLLGLTFLLAGLGHVAQVGYVDRRFMHEDGKYVHI